MIAGYPGRASVAAGEELVVHVATDAPRFLLRIARWGDGFTAMAEGPWERGTAAPERGAAEDWGWPAYRFRVPADWPSGVYVAHLAVPGDDVQPSLVDPAGVLFVVRGTGESPLLYKLPLATYHAYNAAGGGCFYVDPTRSPDPPGSKVSLHRPGGGIAGATYGAVDAYDASSPRQTFAHWDARFVRWLAQRGYPAEFCTDFDLHDDPALCRRYRLLLSVGHDEYWSAVMRDAVEEHVRTGGNVAFFGANICWWRIHVVDGGTAIVCHQGGPRGALDHWWAPTGAGRPEDGLTGVSYRHGGGWWDGHRSVGGFVVQRCAHWAFAGTGLRDGEAFGVATVPPLIGYECDGAPLERDPHGRIVLAPDAATHCGTPPGFAPLAVGELSAAWQELPPRELRPAGAGLHSATMGTFARGGTTFTAGTTDWAQVLAAGDPVVERITANVLDRLLAS